MRPRRSRGRPAERKDGAPAPPAGRAWRGSGACSARRRRAMAASPVLGWGGGAVSERETRRWERCETRTRSICCKRACWLSGPNEFSSFDMVRRAYN
ncbi:hypothetical protein BD309DRAFT_971798 [Dichomitus squalens]|nr:hypothetical protein BD309DRAFT_971798 [Dichomitus squalens]